MNASGKPTVFFSHSSLDKDSLARLKELFVNKTGGTIEVFLSSDGQSISFGRNWVHRIEQALNDAKLMFTFVTPNSLRSNWIYFESGHAYGKGIRVVPVGFLGVGIDSVPAPLSLLQAFNISSEDGLNNLIAVVNEVFDCKFKEGFAVEDYYHIVASSKAMMSAAFGDKSVYIDELTIDVHESNEPVFSFPEGINRLAAFLEQERVECVLHNSKDSSPEYLYSHGFTVRRMISPLPVDKNKKEWFRIRIDPLAVSEFMPYVNKLLEEMISKEDSRIRMCVDFCPEVGGLGSDHRVSARLLGTGTHFAKNYRFSIDDIEFALVGRQIDDDSEKLRSCSLDMQLSCHPIPLDKVRSLLDLLFDRGVLFIGAKS